MTAFRMSPVQTKGLSPLILPDNEEKRGDIILAADGMKRR